MMNVVCKTQKIRKVFGLKLGDVAFVPEIEKSFVVAV